MADEGIKLTADERERLLCDVGCTEGHSRYCAAAMPDIYRVQMDAGDLVERVESIVAARVQALTAELALVGDEANNLRSLLEREMDTAIERADLLVTARAELAAANARIAELETRLQGERAVRRADRNDLAARLERVQALADEWDRTQVIGNNTYADDLRAALGEDA